MEPASKRQKSSTDPADPADPAEARIVEFGKKVVKPVFVQYLGRTAQKYKEQSTLLYYATTAASIGFHQNIRTFLGVMSPIHDWLKTTTKLVCDMSPNNSLMQHNANKTNNECEFIRRAFESQIERIDSSGGGYRYYCWEKAREKLRQSCRKVPKASVVDRCAKIWVEFTLDVLFAISMSAPETTDRVFASLLDRSVRNMKGHRYPGYKFFSTDPADQYVATESEGESGSGESPDDSSDDSPSESSDDSPSESD
jgi:hypothetical protein